MSHRITVAVAAMTTLTLILGSRWWHAQGAVHQILQVEPADLKLGQVWLTDKLNHKLTIRNTSSQEVTISAFDTSCACTALTPSAVLFPPNGSRDIDVTIDLFRIVRESPLADRWPIEVSIQALAADRSITANWRVQGSIASPLKKLPVATLEPLRVSKVDVPRSTVLEVELKEGVFAETATSLTTGLTCRLRSAEPRRAMVEFMINPADIEAGPFRACGQLQLRSQTSNTPLPPFPLELNLVVTPIVVAEPTVVLFQCLHAPKTVTITTSCNRRFAIVDVEACDGIETKLLSTEGEYQERRTLRLTATKSDTTMTLLALRIFVKREGSDVLESVALQVLRPTASVTSAAVE